MSDGTDLTIGLTGVESGFVISNDVILYTFHTCKLILWQIINCVKGLNKNFSSLDHTRKYSVLSPSQREICRCASSG